jgi:hypothetical protein
MSEIKIQCLTCYYENGSYETTYCTYDDGKKNFFGRHSECLEPCLEDDWKHPIYPQYERKYNTHAYKFWKPKTEYEDGILLSDEDFEL